MSTPVGTLLNGRYRLDAQVGSGGMSTVYRAFDTVLERPVAIKLMHREIASDSQQLERFRREARAVAQLSDPHIVTVIDAGEDQGTPYIVFEYVHGETLKERIRRGGPLPIPAAVAYAIEIARALGVAHSRHIVHRDVKPQNVLVDAEGSAKITDFGIARTLTEEGLTADGRVLGTTDYVSPEQALGHPCTGQSDVYSLGILLYEMLTGEVPFRGDNQVSVAMKHVREEIPDVQSRRPEVSAALAAVIEHATAKDLGRRYPDAVSMAADLEDVLTLETARSGQAGGEVTSVLRTLPGSTRRRLPLRQRYPRWWVAGAIAVAVVIVGVLIAALASTHRGVEPNPAAHAPPAAMPVNLRQSAAHDYNPFGTTAEHPESVGLAIDGDVDTSWSTEHYQGGALGKPGVGLYLDAAPRLVARAVEIRTPTSGFDVSIYAANSIRDLPRGDQTPLTQRGWVGPLGTATSVRDGQTIALDTAGTPYRYYLIWITKLPGGSQYAALSELTLFR